MDDSDSSDADNIKEIIYLIIGRHWLRFYDFAVGAFLCPFLRFLS